MKQQSASYTGNREEPRASATCASARGFFQRKSQYDLKGNGVRNHTANGRRWSAIPPSSSERGILAFSRESEKGFTLLEILIAIFILAIIMTIVLGPFTGIMASSRKPRERLTSIRLPDRSWISLRPISVGFFLSLLEMKVMRSRPPRKGSRDDDHAAIGLCNHPFTPDRPQRNRFLSEVTYFLRKNPKDEMYTLIRRSESPPSEPFDEGEKRCSVQDNRKLQDSIHFRGRGDLGSDRRDTQSSDDRVHPEFGR